MTIYLTEKQSIQGKKHSLQFNFIWLGY